MDSEAIPLYNKITSGAATPEEVRNVTDKHVLQKQKKFAWEIKSGAMKCTVRARIKGAVEKKINV